MNTCPHCQFENRPGEMLCARCHQPLSTELGVRTRKIDSEDADEVISEALRVESQSVDADNTVLLYILGEKTPVRVDAKGPTVLGRIHQENPHHPDIDLNAYRAYEKGVSCIHAAIYRESGAVLIEDLGSTNGTFINARRLPPHERQGLSNGDEIRMGNLFARVYFSGLQN